jgi:hypothetical protein
MHLFHDAGCSTTTELAESAEKLKGNLSNSRYIPRALRPLR